MTFAIAALVSFLSCQCSKPAPEYTFPEGEQEPEHKPGEDSGEKPEEVYHKACFIWVDAAANFNDFANSKENIGRDLQKAKDCGFTHVVVDVRPTNGDVLFQTSHCDQVKWLGAWVNGQYKRVERTASFDYLQAFIDQGHKLGLKVYAGFNTFVGGNRNSLGKTGVVFRDENMRENATWLYTKNGTISCMDAGGEIFLNPVSPDVQKYICSLLADLAVYGKKGLDGIILDRGRFMDYNTDFSPYTRKMFEKYIGKTLNNWPADVMQPDMNIGVPKPLPPFYQKWMTFRVKTIYDFMAKARETVKDVDPDVDFGAYAGAWYSQYYTMGVNWASKTYDPSKDFYEEWATPEYGKYGYAEMMDVLIMGAYANPARVYGSSEWTMQGFCRRAMEKTKGKAGLLVGGPDVGNWDYEDKVPQSEENQAIVNSVCACADECDGYFLFDMIHLKQADQWEYAQEGISKLREKETE